MSLTNPKNVVTEERLSEFYGEILPYLGGSADAGFTPVGTIIAVMGVTSPANYLVCDGTVYNIADYPELANYFLQQFGSKNKFGGNGTTTFAVPDLRGEFLRGTGTNSHTRNGNGADVGTHQDGTKIPLYSTGMSAASKLYLSSRMPSGSKPSSYSVPEAMDVTITGADKAIQGTLACVDSTITAATNVYAYTSRPTNTSVLYCIATKNIYLNPSNDYSTDEKVVGTWIDGKKIYQKTIACEMPTCVTNGTQVTGYTSIGASVERVISIDSNITSSSGSQICGENYISGAVHIPSSGTTGNAIMHRIIAINNSASSNKNTIAILNGNTAMNGSTCYVTIKYTKV